MLAVRDEIDWAPRKPTEDAAAADAAASAAAGVAATAVAANDAEIAGGVVVAGETRDVEDLIEKAKDEPTRQHTDNRHTQPITALTAPLIIVSLSLLYDCCSCWCYWVLLPLLYYRPLNSQKKTQILKPQQKRNKTKQNVCCLQHQRRVARRQRRDTGSSVGRSLEDLRARGFACAAAAAAGAAAGRFSQRKGFNGKR